MLMAKARTLGEVAVALNLASSTATLSELSKDTLEFTSLRHKQLRNSAEKLLIKKK